MPARLDGPSPLRPVRTIDANGEAHQFALDHQCLTAGVWRGPGAHLSCARGPPDPTPSSGLISLRRKTTVVPTARQPYNGRRSRRRPELGCRPVRRGQPDCRFSSKSDLGAGEKTDLEPDALIAPMERLPHSNVSIGAASSFERATGAVERTNLKPDNPKARPRLGRSARPVGGAARRDTKYGAVETHPIPISWGTTA